MLALLRRASSPAVAPITESHQLVGPLIGAALGCVGATLADRTRRESWKQSVALAASDQRTRSLLDAERILVAIAREISVLSRSAHGARSHQQPDRDGAALRLLHHAT